MLGTFLAIACAFSWSFALILFKKAGDDIHPVLLNLCKNVLAFVLLLPTALLVEGWNVHVAAGELGILMVSGFLGIGIADAMVLKALTMIGASRIAIVECLYAPFVIALSLLFLGEDLTSGRLFGGGLIISAILCVSLTKDALVVKPQALTTGISLGAVGLLAMAAGIVMIKPLFETIPLFWIITIRMAAGVVASLVIFAALRDKRALLRSLRNVDRKHLVFLACFLSTYVSMTLWVSGYKYNDATVAAVLNQTSTIFTVLLASFLLNERLTLPKIAGTLLAVSGVLLMSFS